MATLRLDQVFLDRLDTGQWISAYSAPGRARAMQVDGDTRKMAGGRLRSFSQVGVSGTHGFVLRMLTLAQIQTLEAWMAPVIVQYRDNRGQIFTGVYRSVAPVEFKVPYWWDVPISLELVTVD
jgi:hypothetical protein